MTIQYLPPESLEFMKLCMLDLHSFSMADLQSFYD